MTFGVSFRAHAFRSLVSPSFSSRLFQSVSVPVSTSYLFEKSNCVFMESNSNIVSSSMPNFSSATLGCPLRNEGRDFHIRLIKFNTDTLSTQVFTGDSRRTASEEGIIHNVTDLR